MSHNMNTSGFGGGPPSRRRQSRFRPSVGTIVTSAVVAYGTYRLVDWFWSSNEDEQEEEYERRQQQQQQQQQQNGIFNNIGQWFGGGGMMGQQQQQHQPQFNQNDTTTVRLNWRERRNRLTRCREETFKAMERLSSAVRKTIEDATNTSKETKELKRLRSEQRGGGLSNSSNNNSENDDDQQQLQQQQQMLHYEQDLWEKIKTQNVTRMVATAYSHTILFLVLTVQVHLLGGKLFYKQQEIQQRRNNNGGGGGYNRRHQQLDDNYDEMESYQESHRLVLIKTYDYFFEHGIKLLIDTVHRAVSHVLAEWDVSNPSSMRMSRDVLDEALHDIRTNILYGTTNSIHHRRNRRPNHHSRRSLLRFLLPPDDTTFATSASGANTTTTDSNSNGHEGEIEDSLAGYILDETWDILESPVLEDAQEECLNQVFNLMRDKNWGTIFDDVKDKHDNDGNTSNNNSNDNDENNAIITQPLATVIAQFKNTSNSFYKKKQKNNNNNNKTGSVDYISYMTTLPCVLELGDVSFH